MGVIIITSKGIEHVSKDVPKQVIEATGLEARTYTLEEAREILEQTRNNDEYFNEDFDLFMYESLTVNDEDFEMWALKATQVEIIEEFIKRFYANKKPIL